MLGLVCATDIIAAHIIAAVIDLLFSAALFILNTFRLNSTLKKYANSHIRTCQNDEMQLIPASLVARLWESLK